MKKWIAPIGALAVIGLIVAFGGKKTPTPPAEDIASQTVAGERASAEPITNDTEDTTTTTMKIETITEGSGPGIANGQIAVVQYEGKLESGTVFDSTAKHGGAPFEFPLGAGMVIQGWEQGVLGMKVGETRLLTIPPELGYGEAGAGGGLIPPNATLIFSVTLQGIK
jgi:FKBP-type peptidyl-prolyl cis-trans isomerase